MATETERERHPKRPTTPLQRISRGSLRSHSLSLSASRSRSQSRPSRPTSPSGDPTATLSSSGDPCPSLSHLQPFFSDLSDAFADLHANLEELETVHRNLDGFNEAFGGFVYGLRMNAYTTDFPEAPGVEAFRRAAERRKREAEEASTTKVAVQEGGGGTRGVWGEPTSPTNFSSKGGGNETTFMSNRDDLSGTGGGGDSDSDDPSPPPTVARSGVPASRGRGGSVRGGRGGSTSTAASKAAQQKALLKWTSAILPSLPILFREKQPHRSEMERVLIQLRTHPDGLYVPDFTKLDQTLAAHRARECVNALVAAKYAVKINKNGLLYKLDDKALNAK